MLAVGGGLGHFLSPTRAPAPWFIKRSNPRVRRLERPMPTEKQSIQTLTGELFQPIRLYYRLHNKSAVQVAFNKLHCMDFDTPGQRWVGVYDNEAKKLQFNKPWSSIPPERRPIVLGSFYTRVDEEMYLDVGSIERALAAIAFFNRHIKRASAEL